MKVIIAKVIKASKHQRSGHQGQFNSHSTPNKEGIVEKGLYSDPSS
jgi:hypothetical protein